MSAVLPHHVSHEPLPAERGRAFGGAHADAIGLTVRTYRRLFGMTPPDMRSAGAALAPSLGADHVEELEGMAAGAGQDVRDLLAVNARTELLAGSGRAECSVIGRVAGSGVTLAQTWDWHPDLAPARVVWTVHLPGDTWFTTATEAGILAKLGLNSHGVACALNFLTCSADGGGNGVPIHVLLRQVLEHAVDARHAVALLCGAPTAASSAVTIASAGRGGSELVAVELSPGGGVVVRPDADGWLVHANHFLAAPPRGVDQEPAAGPGSRLRQDHLDALVRGGAPPDAALASHLPHEEPVCRHVEQCADDPWDDRLATLLAMRIDPGAPSFALAAGPPCCTPFAPVPLPQAVGAG